MRSGWDEAGPGAGLGTGIGTATGLSSSSDDITMARDFFVGLTAESVLDPIEIGDEDLGWLDLRTLLSPKSLAS